MEYLYQKDEKSGKKAYNYTWCVHMQYQKKGRGK